MVLSRFAGNGGWSASAWMNWMRQPSALALSARSFVRRVLDGVREPHSVCLHDLGVPATWEAPGSPCEINLPRLKIL